MSELQHNETKCYVRTIRDLLIDNIDNVKLRIPSYQRKYTWDKENRRQLCQDIITARRSGTSEYHLGTLIFHQNGDYLDIVDGQQRLTTIGMMLSSQNNVQIQLEYARTDWVGKENLWQGISLWENDRTRSELLTMIPDCTVVCIVVTDIAEAFQLFSTQNGRGKELTPVNLLKAYHFHEMGQVNGGLINHQCSPPTEVYRIEGRWEYENSLITSQGEQLLTEVLSEHLFRLRKWGYGEFITDLFSRLYLSEFKGITLDNHHETLPLMNSALLRRLFKTHYQRSGLSLQGLGNRLGDNQQDPQTLDPFVTVNQSIINGEDFFSYASTFVTEYQLLFPTYEKTDKRPSRIKIKDIPELTDYHDFYERNCLKYPGSERKGDSYARHIFESLCIMLFDRFGISGLISTYKHLFRFAYFERYKQERLFYQTAGSNYAVRCCNAILSSETKSELEKQFDSLTNDIKEKLSDRKDKKCFSDNTIDGQERIQLMSAGRIV